MGLNTLIASYRSSFWLSEKKWLVMAAYILRTNEIWLHTIPFHSINSEKAEVRFELSSMENSFRLVTRPTSTILESDSNLTFTTLELGYNHIGPRGAKQLVDVLRKNKALTTLCFSYNQLGPEGTHYIADFLKDNTHDLQVRIVLTECCLSD
ncbi:unnamed protein product [Rotaria sordida]|uniref:Uncharacterized protein n=1 Tax=Rotaria sordida TaxID=392033 RepID=A0A815QMV0_9BILA|nr:unnamed protein product [Rotaria sordida]